MPVILKAVFTGVLQAFLSILTKMATPSLIKWIVLYCLGKLVLSTKTKFDDELFAKVKEAMKDV